VNAHEADDQEADRKRESITPAELDRQEEERGRVPSQGQPAPGLERIGDLAENDWPRSVDLLTGGLQAYSSRFGHPGNPLS
jgi:hypothetical protein